MTSAERPVSLAAFDARYEGQCAALIDALPEWFGIPESNASYLRNLAALPSWLAIRDRTVVGAATLEAQLPGSFEIHFLAVHPSCHRQGIGRRLVDHLEV